jgi:hypothetical protein
VQVLAKHHPGLKVHGDVRTLDLAAQVTEGVLIDVVVISTPCVDVSCRGLGHGQESVPFFTAVDRVKQYADVTGHLPTIISENVQGRRFRHRNEVRCVRYTLQSCVNADAVYDKATGAGEMDAALSEDGG